MTHSRPLVLLVDDDEMVLDLLSSCLEATGFRTVSASNGREAIDKFHRHAFSIVISDVGLGGDIDGLDVLDAIRKEDRHTPVIVMSGAGDDVEQAAIERGAHAFVSKPFDPGKVLHLARRALATGR